MVAVCREASLSYDDFRTKYLLPNIPVIIGSDLTRSWPAMTLWSHPRDDTSISSRPNLDYLAETYGDLEVPVDEEGCRSKCALKDVIDQWNQGQGRSLYVKDWHLARQRPEDAFYSTPNVFHDDWMNAYYLKETEDDFRFVVWQACHYMRGP